jgi:hypothetical protein
MAPVMLLGALLLGALFLGACNGDDPAPTPTSTPTATATPAATPGVPEGTTTGIAEVDAVIEAVLRDDAAALVALMQTVDVPCTNAQGAGGPPKCWAGTTPDQARPRPTGRPEGTVLEVFPYSTCELEWRIDLDPVAEEATTVAGELFAVLALDQPLFTGGEDYLPAAEHAIIFTGTNADAESVLVVAIQGGRITFIDRACGAGTAARDYIDERPPYASAEVILRGPAYAE